jgi:hypothetical protein
MGQFVHNGILYEELPNGQARVIGPAQGAPSSAIGPAIGGNPLIPGQLAGQALTNTKERELTPLQIRAAKADAAKKELDLKTAQEAYNAAHPKPNVSGLFGADFLKTLPVPDQELVKALAEGRLGFPGGFALKAPWWQQKLQEVAQYDPSFDATNFNNRAKARATLLTGKVGSSANALNTAIGHIGLLNSQIPGTASHGGFPFATSVNALENWFARGSGDQGITNFTDTASKLADELETAYRNGGGAEQGVVRQLRNLDPNMSLEQKQGIIGNALELLASKQAANLYQYNIGSGGKPEVDLLDPAARKVLDQFPAIRDKYFAPPPQNLSSDAAGLLKANGGTLPPPSRPSGNDTPNGPGFSKSPTGRTDTVPALSTNGYSDTPDAQSAAFWEDAARQGLPYRTALSQWQGDVRARGLTGIEPPPPSGYHKAASYMRDHPNIEYHPFQSVTRTPTDPIDAAMTAAVNNGPTQGALHFVNAAAANLPTRAAGEQGDRFLAVSNAEHPNWSFAGDLGGTIAGAYGAGKGVGAIAPSLGRFGSLIAANPARTALTGDLLFGGASGAAQNPDNPVGGGLLGAGAMAAGNVAGRMVVAPGLRVALDSPLVQRGINAAKGMFSGRPFAPPEALDPGQNLIFNRGGAALDGIRTNLQDAAGLGLPYTLADSSPKLRALAGSSVRKSANARQLAEDVINPRQMGQAERVIGQIDRNLAPVGDVPTMVNDATAQARAASKPLYDAAFSQPVPDLARHPELANILRRPAAETALRRAYDLALNEGTSPAELSISVGADGRPLLNANPTWKTLHYVRRGLDEEIASAIDPVTGKVRPGMGDSQRAMIGLRGALDNQIGQINPGFKAADAEYSRFASQGTAAQRGAAASGIRVTPEQAQIGVTEAGDNLPLFQRGYASSLADQVERSRLTGNPHNLIYGSLGQRAKIGTVFPQGAPQFARANALEGDMSRMAYETLGGSPTAARFEADKAFEGPNMGDMAFDLGLSAATGVPPVGLLQRGLRGFATGAKDRFNLGRGGQAKADAIAPLLLNTDPNANLVLLNSIFARGAARKAYLQQLQAAGGQVGAGMFAAPILGLNQQ